MELCDESLTAFLERSPGPLSYHTQVNIAHDIALALVYLHSNGLIHRDLTGNNVLMIAGIRAKITDFGMSKLATVNPRMTALTLCPGNVLYMSPEALDEAKSYTSKLDIFSFGVIVVQILTRQFPNPTDRFRLVSVPQFQEPLRQLVPETERRQAHLRSIADSHPDSHALKPLALQCLKKKENERPSAQQLSERLSELKQSSWYTESWEQAEHSSSEIEQLQLQLRSLADTKAREAARQREQISGLENMVQERDREIQDKDREIQEKDREIQAKDRHLQEKHRALEVAIASLEQNDKAITDLQQTMAAQGKIAQPLGMHFAASQATAQQQPLLNTKTNSPQGDIRKMGWRVRKKAPQAMVRGTAVVHGNMLYLNPVSSPLVYSYQITEGEGKWSQMPDNPYRCFGLVIVEGSLTSIGGRNPHQIINTLRSLKGGNEKKEWAEILPPMPTARCNGACVTTEQALVVAGGGIGHVFVDAVDVVEVMNIGTKEWSVVSPLPQKCSSLSFAVCGDTLYLGGGFTSPRDLSNSIFTCRFQDLFRPNAEKRHSIVLWREIKSLPVVGSTLVSFSGDLLAIGGRDDSRTPTSDVYRYNSRSDSWTVVSQMKNALSVSLVASFPENCLLVVGGYTFETHDTMTSSVQALE
jgi:hypothetical protein